MEEVQVIYYFSFNFKLHASYYNLKQLRHKEKKEEIQFSDAGMKLRVRAVPSLACNWTETLLI